VIQVAISPSLIMTRADSPYKTLAEAIAAAKANPKAVNYGTAGHGTFPQLAVELLQQNGNFSGSRSRTRARRPRSTTCSAATCSSRRCRSPRARRTSRAARCAASP
jgi:hypothetical protein